MSARPEGLGSRDRILWAAASMLGEDPGAALSVRAVAARAAVSTGSLRHHFPTQRALMDEVLAMLYELALPEDTIDDSSIPARDRLLGCLQQLLAPQADMDPRDAWLMTFDRYVRGEPTHEAREEYLAIERQTRRRIEHCLSVLEREGAVAAGRTTRHATFLITVVTGISIAQALPSEPTRVQDELAALHEAVDAVLRASD